MAKLTGGKTSAAHQRYIALIRAIPKGKVATYGQIARLAGDPRAARQVVRALHSSSRKYKLPWHRVINSQGKLSIPDERVRLRQRALLAREGVEFVRPDTVNLERFGWRPGLRAARL